MPPPAEPWGTGEQWRGWGFIGVWGSEVRNWGQAKRGWERRGTSHHDPGMAWHSLARLGMAPAVLCAPCLAWGPRGEKQSSACEQWVV